ncbi:MAG: hypothetical protein ABIW85_00215 [Variovorax sp.]
MRVFGLIGLVVALLVVALVAKKQLTAVVPPVLPGAASPALGSGGSGKPETVRQQSQQIQDQYRQALDSAMKPRPQPDEAK